MIEKMDKTEGGEAGTMAQWFRAWVRFPAPTWLLTTNSNSSSKGI